MTTIQIKAFLQIIYEGNMSKAAENLFITQPALSRIVKTLESNVGGNLFNRQRGKHSVELTTLGEAFLPIAEKWHQLYVDTSGLTQQLHQIKYTITATDSLNTCVFPSIYEKMLGQYPSISLCIRSHHTFDSYSDIEMGRADIGFVSTERYSKKVKSFLLFKEKMLLIYAKHIAFPEILSPDQLDPSEEIRIPWFFEYDLWHNYWFDASIAPKVVVDKISIVSEFILSPQNCWAIVPSTVAEYLCKSGLFTTSLLVNGPRDRNCYCIFRKCQKEHLHNILLSLINEHIKDIPGITPLGLGSI